MEEKEKCIGLELAAIKRNVDDIAENRTKLITSEMSQWRNKRGRDYFTKTKEKRHARGGLVIVRGMTSNQRELKLLRDLSQDNAYILRESDKNLGCSLNNSSWYKKEYDSV